MVAAVNKRRSDVKLRPLAGARELGHDEAALHCDWGNCRWLAVSERWDEEHGWLPVCCTHERFD